MSSVKWDRQITEERDKYGLEWDRRCGKHFQKIILFVTYLSTSSLIQIFSVMGQPKFEGLTLFRIVNHEGVATVLVTVAN